MRGPAGDLSLLEQNDVRPAAQRQMIGDRTADDAGAGDHHARLRRRRGGRRREEGRGGGVVVVVVDVSAPESIFDAVVRRRRDRTRLNTGGDGRG